MTYPSLFTIFQKKKTVNEAKVQALGRKVELQRKGPTLIKVCSLFKLSITIIRFIYYRTNSHMSDTNPLLSLISQQLHLQVQTLKV